MEPPPYIPSVYKSINKDFQFKVLYIAYNIFMSQTNWIVTSRNIPGRLVMP